MWISLEITFGWHGRRVRADAAEMDAGTGAGGSGEGRGRALVGAEGSLALRVGHCSAVGERLQAEGQAVRVDKTGSTGVFAGRASGSAGGSRLSVMRESRGNRVVDNTCAATVAM